MKQIISDNKFVELTYKIINQDTDKVITHIEVPLGYVHGQNTQLFEQVTEQLDGKSVGEKVEVIIDCTKMFGKYDNDLVITNDLKSVPEEYHSIGTKITMENSKGEAKEFFVIKITDKQLTIDGNSPLCGKKIIFSLEILTIRDATDEEIEAGGSTEQIKND